MEERLAALVRERDADPAGRGESGPAPAGRTRCSRCSATAWLIDRPDGTPRAFAMGVRERDEAVDSPLYARGELDQPGEVVPRGLVRVLCDETPRRSRRGAAVASWPTGSPRPRTR